MKRGWIVNVLLLVVVAGLGWYIFYRPAEEAPQHKLTTLVPSAVSQAVIEPRGGKPIELAKRGDAWYLVRPFQGARGPKPGRAPARLTSATSKRSSRQPIWRASTRIGPRSPSRSGSSASPSAR
jgi:hypothetical protein